eukprot:SAG11_NODE_2184_length_3711_cov_6.483942_2_plen_147_part_00
MLDHTVVVDLIAARLIELSVAAARLADGGPRNDSNPCQACRRRSRPQLTREVERLRSAAARRRAGRPGLPPAPREQGGGGHALDHHDGGRRLPPRRAAAVQRHRPRRRLGARCGGSIAAGITVISGTASPQNRIETAIDSSRLSPK